MPDMLKHSVNFLLVKALHKYDSEEKAKQLRNKIRAAIEKEHKRKILNAVIEKASA